MKTSNELRKSQWMLIVAGLLSIAGLPIVAQLSWHRFVLLDALSVASLMVGSIVGFLFTSYGEEAGTVGKVRDWLVGGITAITVLKAESIKGLLLDFAVGPEPNEYALVVAIAITYSVFGFLYMFVQRELILNVLLAESRAERGRLEGTREAGQVVLRLLANIPANILSGSEDIDILDTLSKAEGDALRDQLNSSEVTNFLQQADQAVKAGNADWQIVAIAANLYCYRTYFESNGEARLQKAKIAACWLDRALLINSKHVDFTVKRAAIAGEMKRTGDTTLILEALNRRSDAPFFVRQWLGFYLLDYPERLDESIEYSKSYHSILPEESDALFNIAAAYGRKYCQNARKENRQPNPSDRENALVYLKQALDRQPDYVTAVRDKWSKPDGSFSCLKDDDEFRLLVGLTDKASGDA